MRYSGWSSARTLFSIYTALMPIVVPWLAGKAKPGPLRTSSFICSERLSTSDGWGQQQRHEMVLLQLYDMFLGLPSASSVYNDTAADVSLFLFLWLNFSNLDSLSHTKASVKQL